MRSLATLACSCFLTLVSGCGGSNTESGPVQPQGESFSVAPVSSVASLPTWTARGDLLGKLDEEAVLPFLPPYYIRPPKGYARKAIQSPPGTAWVGPARADGSSPGLSISREALPGSLDLMNDAGLRDFFAGMLSSIRQGQQLRDWKETAPERGRINAFTFARVRWNGATASGARLHGFVYVTVEGPIVTSVAAAVAEPGHEQPLALMESAVFTIRKAGVGTKPLQPNEPLVAWTADKQLLTRLDPEVVLPFQTPLRIRPPKEYKQEQLPARGSEGFGWLGPVRPDGISPILTVTFRVQPRPVDLNAIEFFFLGALSDMRSKSDWKETPVERGKVNGRTSARIRWSMLNETNVRIHGFQYVITDGANLISARGMVPEPNQAEALQLMEAAVLTIQKSNQPP